MTESDAATASERGARMHRLVRRVWLTFAVVLAVIGFAVLFTRVAASPTVCGSCHEMERAVETWRISAHTRVGCPACHEEPRAWYELPATLADRTRLLARDVAIHVSRSPDEDGMPHDTMAAQIPDETCERCHTPERAISIRYGTLIDHTEHAERNGSCVSCHLLTAHPVPEVQRSLQLMDQCFTCHGRAADASAPGTCDTCHPDSFDLRPVSHATDEWAAAHGAAATAGLEPCLMCHDQTACDSCHGVRMPHPDGWAEDGTLHGSGTATSSAVCARCHTPVTDFCADCHHEGYDPDQGPWLEQHGRLSSERGAAHCLSCHAPTHCVECHTERADD